MFVISATQIKAAPVAVKASAKKVEKKRYAHYFGLTFSRARSPRNRGRVARRRHPSVARLVPFASWWQPKPRVSSYLTSNYSSNGPSFEALQTRGTASRAGYEWKRLRDDDDATA